jgi:cytoskeletal protein CcmA (bactofilin family)
MAAASRPTAPTAAAPAAAYAGTPAQVAAPAPAAPAERVPAAPLSRPASKRVLTVGPEIQMKGEVTSCDRVIIEGAVDATMRDVHTVELAETGSLKGTAEVEDAEISGSFEGDLVVRGRLTVYSSGRVRGNVTYGEIEIQRGGQISGNIRNVADAKAAAQGQQQKKAA